jgi:uncharacterized repeat protein (TIGR03803 family)
VIYRFQSTADGNSPFGQLTVDNATGIVYGTTEYGGKERHQCGTAFKLTPTSHGYVHTTLYNFAGFLDGCLPQGQILIGKSGALLALPTSPAWAVPASAAGSCTS